MFSRVFSWSAVALVGSRLVLRAAAEDRHFSLNIENAVVSPDNFPRSAITTNGGVPGPLISGNTGDRFLINVTDSLTDPTMRRSTSIHWHGMFQKMDHTMSMDGSAFVTQCPIVPGHSFMYNFSCPTQSGTYWYHSHLSTQYCDGLTGPMVVYDPEDPHKGLYDVDDESTIISLRDWYHTVAPDITDVVPPTPDSTLINGLGRWSADPTGELAVVRSQGGKRHRFRLINMACEPSYTFSIDGHNMTVIETDGIETEPVTVDSLQIFAGQRYSVVVTMDQPVDNYWIRALPSRPVNSTTTGGINSAILRYDGAESDEPSNRTPKDSSKESVILKETDLHPIVSPGAPGEPYPGGADVVLTLEPGRINSSWTVNNVSFVHPSAPILLQILSGVVNAKDLLPAGSVYELPLNATIEINVPAINDHPFHLHGHTFDVVRTAGSDTYNFVNPVRRDVVTPGNRNDTVTLRFVTDNPGPWFFHCHIDWHFEGGLGVVFAEGASEVDKIDAVNSEWSDLCPLYDQLNPDKHLESPGKL